MFLLANMAISEKDRHSGVNHVRHLHILVLYIISRGVVGWGGGRGKEDEESLINSHVIDFTTITLSLISPESQLKHEQIILVMAFPHSSG